MKEGTSNFQIYEYLGECTLGYKSDIEPLTLDYNVYCQYIGINPKEFIEHVLNNYKCYLAFSCIFFDTQDETIRCMNEYIMPKLIYMKLKA